MPIKGPATKVFSNQSIAALSDWPLDCREYNAVNLLIFVSGTNPSAVVSVEGSPEQGGTYQALPDPNASQTVTASTSIDVVVGTGWAKVRLASVTGTFGGGQGYTIFATPYVSPGTSRVEATLVVDTLSAIQANTGTLTISDVCTIGDGGSIAFGGSAASIDDNGLHLPMNRVGIPSDQAAASVVDWTYLTSVSSIGSGTSTMTIKQQSTAPAVLVQVFSDATTQRGEARLSYSAVAGGEFAVEDEDGVEVLSVGTSGAGKSGVMVAPSAGFVGFYGTSPQAKPEITGSRDGNAALASLLSALATLGLLTDSTTV